MKTIKGLIAAGLAETEATRRIRRDEVTRRVYDEHPELKEIDSRIIDIRKDRLIAVIDHDESLSIERLPSETHITESLSRG